MTQKGADFHLPDEILAVIPTDPYDQLDLARRITSVAISSRVSCLEGEAERLRHKIADKDRVIEELQEQLAHLDRLVQESETRLRETVEENAVLSEERDKLATTSKKLAKNLSKLEMFKRHLMKSLNDDYTSKQSETIDVGTYKQPIARISSWSDDGSNGHVGLNAANGSTETGDSTQDRSEHSMHQFTLAPYITPRLTPVSTPKISTTDGSPRGFSTTGSSPRLLSGVTSPTKYRFDEYGSMSPWYASSQQSSASSSPPRRQPLSGRAPRIDGKELFRQARSRLSCEQFAAFLANVKEFNAKRQSREVYLLDFPASSCSPMFTVSLSNRLQDAHFLMLDFMKETLAKVEEIFTTENKDLYLYFQSLLNSTVR